MTGQDPDFTWPEKLGDPYGWLLFGLGVVCVFVFFAIAIELFCRWEERRRNVRRDD